LLSSSNVGLFFFPGQARPGGAQVGDHGPEGQGGSQIEQAIADFGGREGADRSPI